MGTTVTIIGHGIARTVKSSRTNDTWFGQSFDRAVMAAFEAAYLIVIGETDADRTAWGEKSNGKLREVESHVFERTQIVEASYMRQKEDGVWRQDPATKRDFEIKIVSDFRRMA